MILSDVIARSWRFVPLGLALLLVGTPAHGQDCGGASDACERGPAALSPAATVHDRGAISPEAAKVASSVRDAIEAIASTAAVPSAPRDLRALSTRLVHVSATGELQLYVILGDFQPAHVQHLEASGLRVELTLPAHRLVQGWLPANLVDVVAALPFVVEVRAPGYPVAHVGAQVTAGDSILRADAARATFDVSGAGVTVGVVSDGVDHLALSAATADVPSGVQVLQNPGGDEGTAMLEIVHDVAPGAGLAFYGPTTSADMVAGINALAGAGARVIVDDLTFLDEPKFQDGMIAQTARAFATGGRAYVTAAGNSATMHYRAPYRRLTGQNFPSSTYPAVHNYVASGVDIGNTLVLPSNCGVRVVLQWNNPAGASADDFDLFLARSADGAVLARSLNAQTGSQSAFEFLAYTNTTGGPLTVFIAIAEFRLRTAPASLILDYFVYPECGFALQYATSADSVIGHAAVNEVLSVATANAQSPGQAAFYSSRGPGSISFPSVESRSTPNITGIDCVATEIGAVGFFDFPFCGTSAAAPHVAGIVALLMERSPTSTSPQLRDAVTRNAVDLGSAGFDTTFGFGRADALAAVGALKPQVTLAVSRAGSGTGTVTSSPAGISCGATCSASFTSGTRVMLAATAGASAVFSGWTGCDTASGTTCAVTLSAARTITATFNPSTARLAVTRAGTGTGTVTSNPAGIACGATCAATFPFNRAVTLTAAPSSGSLFAGWSGDCSGTAMTCTVTMGATRSVTPTFVLRAPATLSVVKSGTGIGTVTSAPAGVSCGAVCAATYAGGAVVTLTATANAASSFAGWSGACLGTATCRLTLITDVTVTATFTPKPQRLTISRTGSGSGAVTSDPPGISCPATCAATFAGNSTVSMSAAPSPGSTFTGWSGACHGADTTCTVSMTAAQSVIAMFTAQTFSVSVSRDGSGNGTITSSPGGINCGTICSANYLGGRVVTLTATPAVNSAFSGWSGDCTGRARTCTVTVTSSLNVTATFDATTAPVRFYNNLVLCPPSGCVRFTAILHASEGPTWSSLSGAPSAYQTIRTPTLSNFTVTAVGFSGSVFFPGSFSLTFGRRYTIVLNLDGSGNGVLQLFDEGPATSASTAAPAAGAPAVELRGRADVPFGGPLRRAPEAGPVR